MPWLLSIATSTLSVMIYALPPVFIGFFLANVLAASAFLSRGGVKFIPALSRATRLPPTCVAAVLLSIGDRTAGLAALAIVKEKEGLTDAQIIASALVAKAPSAIQAFTFSFAPMMMAMFPLIVTVRFMSLYYAVFVLVTIIGLVYARTLAKASEEHAYENTQETERPGWKVIVTQAFRNTLRPFFIITMWLLGMSFLASLIARSGVMDGLATYLPIPPRQIPIAAAGLVSIFGGVGAAGVAFKDGFLTVPQIVPLLFATALLHNTYDLFASVLPLTMSVFRRALGVKVALGLFAATQFGILIGLVLLHFNLV
jgi:hypothetical protein